MKFFDLLRTIIAWPFLAVAFLFWKVYEAVDPFVEWELEHYNDVIIFGLDDDDEDDCC